MNIIKNISFPLIIAGMSISSTGQSNNKENTPVTKITDVEVYYLHNTRRCRTCKAVEAESKKAVEKLYGDKTSFAAYNLEESKGEQQAKKLLKAKLTR